MANEYFTHLANIIPAGVRALAAQVNNIANEISTGLDKLPTEVQLKRGTTRFAVDAGSANTYVVTMAYTPTLIDGLEIAFRAANTNTGASTLNANGLGAKSIVYFDKSTLTANAILVDAIVTVRYSSTLDAFVMQSQSGKVVTIGDADTLDGIDSTGFVRNGAATPTSSVTTASAVTLTENLATSGGALEVNVGQAAGFTGYGLLVLNPTGGDSGSRLVDIQPSGAAIGLSISGGSSGFSARLSNSNNGRALQVVSSATTGNAAMSHFTANNLGYTGDLMQVDAAHGGQAIQVSLSGTGGGVRVDAASSGTGAVLVDAYANNAANTTQLLQVIQDHASATGTLLNLRQDGTAASAYGIELQMTASAATGINVTHTGTGNVLDATMSAGGGGISISTTGSTASSAPGLSVANSNTAQSGNYITLSQSAAASAAVLCAMSQSGTGQALSVTANNASRTGTLVSISEQNAASTADSLVVTHAPTDGNSNGLWMRCTGTGNQARGIFLDHEGTGAADALLVSLAGSGNGINVSANAAAGTAIRAYSNVATRSQALVEVINDNATGAGNAMLIQQDQGGNALRIEHNAAAVVSGVQVLAESTSNLAATFYSNTASRTQPLVLVHNDNATGSGVALAIQQDQGGAGIDLSSSAGAAPIIGSQGNHVDSGLFAVKASDEEVTNSDTLQDDNDLTVTLAANATYRITAAIWVISASSTPGWKYDWVESDGTWVNLRADGSNEISRGYESASSGALTLVLTIPEMVTFEFIVVTAGAGGAFKLQWAQNVSNATATVVKKGSWMNALRLA